MKDNDKVTLTVKQLRGLVTESSSKDIKRVVEEIVDFIEGSTMMNRLAWDVDEGILPKTLFTDPQFLQALGRRLAKAIKDERYYINH